MSNFSAEQIRAGVALQSMRDTYPDLDRWRARSAQIEEPQTGSELHGDAQIWRGFAPHQMARVALVSAVQHLNLVRASVEAKELFPIAMPTALRGALLGAARGVWLLAPDLRHDRQQRGLRTIHEVHRRYLQYLESNPQVFQFQKYFAPVAVASKFPPSSNRFADNDVCLCGRS